LLGSRDLLLPILCAISLVLHPPCWPISRDRSLGNTRRAVAVFGGLGTPNKRNLLLPRLRWDLLSLSNRLICVHYIIYIYVCVFVVLRKSFYNDMNLWIYIYICIYTIHDIYFPLQLRQFDMSCNALQLKVIVFRFLSDHFGDGATVNNVNPVRGVLAK
jgi:hypothetical protein